MKSGWVRIPLKILLVWLVITVYFYFQQPVIYRCQDFNVNLPIGGGQLLFHEINVSNYDEDRPLHLMEGDKLPWQMTLYQKMVDRGLPVSWYIPVYKVLSFYSWPPVDKDSYYLYMDGIFIDAQEAAFDERPSALERFSVYTYPGGSGNGTGSMRAFFRNADMISAHGRIDPRQMDQPLIVTIVDNDSSLATKFILTPDWKKERLLERARHYQSPADPVRSFLYQVHAGQAGEAVKNILPQRRSNVPLPTLSSNLAGKDIMMEGLLTWMDIYEGYYNVYRVDAEIGAFSEEEFVPEEDLTFYTIRDQEGNFKIINWK